MSLFCAQTGLIQIGEDSLFIQPVGENDPSQSFSGRKHRLLRLRRSAKTSSAPDADQPSYCGNVRGEWHRELDWMVQDIGLWSHWSQAFLKAIKKEMPTTYIMTDVMNSAVFRDRNNDLWRLKIVVNMKHGVHGTGSGSSVHFLI